MSFETSAADGISVDDPQTRASVMLLPAHRVRPRPRERRRIRRRPARWPETGWFFDQRDNRRLVATLAPDARVLDLYCFTGGFAVQAARAGAAAVLGVDSSEPALSLAANAAT